MKKLSKDIDLYYKVWDQVEDKKAVIILFHGMVEHIMRYDDFAKFLNENGIVVCGMDVRGHGKTGKNSYLGYFADDDGWNKVLEDQNDLINLIKSQYEDLPMFLLGHSMGSFFARNYINKYPDDFEAAIIMGTGKADDPAYAFARFILKLFNEQKPAKLMNNMAFGSYNKAIDKPRTDFDWLSRDFSQVDKYIKDPLCGFLVKNSFYKDFMSGMKQIAELEKAPKYTRPCLFIAGKEDPVGGMGTFVEEAYSIYENAELKLYDGMRHEILNELNNRQVYEDILSWILSNIA